MTTRYASSYDPPAWMLTMPAGVASWMILIGVIVYACR